MVFQNFKSIELTEISLVSLLKFLARDYHRVTEVMDYLFIFFIALRAL